jgi:hypothetical protein
MCRAGIKAILPRVILAVSLTFVSAIGVQAHAQAISQEIVLQVQRDSELKGDKLPSSLNLQKLHRNDWVQLMTLEGGWAQVRVVTQNQVGWMRASALKLKTSVSEVARISQSAREAKMNTVFTLGVRNAAKGVNHHALIITAGRHNNWLIAPRTPWLRGAHADTQSAKQIAAALLIPDANITYLTDKKVQSAGIMAALQDLTHRLHEGDKAFVYFSGFGGADKACDGGLWMHDKTILKWSELAKALAALNQKTDRAFVVVDAGFDQPLGGAMGRVHRNKNDDGLLQAKSFSRNHSQHACGQQQANLDLGLVPQDFVLWQSSASDQTSYDDSAKGGLATQYLRDCLLRDAKDIDDSADISMDELRQCAQAKIEVRLHGDGQAKPQTIGLMGNRMYVPIRPKK